MLDWFFSLFFSVSLSSTPAQIFRSHKKYSFLKFDPYFRIIRTRFCCCDIHITRNSNKVLSLSYIILYYELHFATEMKWYSTIRAVTKKLCWHRRFTFFIWILKIQNVEHPIFIFIYRFIIGYNA